ncbi:MAG TPA: pseudouridine synthase, partial [Actinobacteria bacterium]|nr:pseudouridine synthase [Actinomycetota bacterium]
MLMRISRFLSSAGIASRRKSESLILDGKITVNGVIVKDLSARIDTCRDKVKFLDKEILLQEKVYLALNKPPGYLSTVKDNFN